MVTYLRAMRVARVELAPFSDSVSYNTSPEGTNVIFVRRGEVRVQNCENFAVMATRKNRGQENAPF